MINASNHVTLYFVSHDQCTQPRDTTSQHVPGGVHLGVLLTPSPGGLGWLPGRQGRLVAVGIATETGELTNGTGRCLGLGIAGVLAPLVGPVYI